MPVMQERYLRWLRVESPLSITVIVSIVIAALVPYSTYAMIGVLFLGMIFRSMSCSVAGGSPLANMVVLVPAWPAYVAVDSIREWMQRMGFGPAFRASVTGVLFALCWLPFLGTGGMVSASVLIICTASTVLLREYGRGPWYLAPSVVLTLFYLRMWT